MQKIKMTPLAKKEYNITNSFKNMEETLIKDLMNNIKEYTISSAGGDSNYWYIRQIKMLEDYRLSHKELFDRQFSGLNNQVSELIMAMRKAGANAEEIRIAKAIRRGYQCRKIQNIGMVEQINNYKLNALINATMRDMTNAEQAILRKTDDKIRKVLFDAKMQLNTGTLSYNQAIDKATQDLLNNGIQCVQYRNGAVHKLSDYCEMAVKTADKRAYLIGEGQKRAEYGLHLIIMGQRSDTPCECCIPYIGEILVDDVYSGGTAAEAGELGYELLSEAMANGLYHPRCKDSHTTYFPGITKKPEHLTDTEITEILDKKKDSQNKVYKERQAEKYNRLYKFSLDTTNKNHYKTLRDNWEK